MSRLRESLKAGRRLFGTHVSLSDHRICEMLGYLGFDYLWIDMEHSSIDYRTLEMHLIAAQAAGTPAIVRVPWNDVPHVKRVLEAGPAGLVFPMINSVEEARLAIDTCIYPPEGKRGFGPLRANRYGMEDLQTYIHTTSREPLILLQIETLEAVKAQDEIMKLPFIDGFILGPMDLSGSIGQLGRYLEPDTDRLVTQVVQKAHAAGYPIGVSVGSHCPKELAYWMDKGFDMISSTTDVLSIIRGAKEVLETLRGLEANPR